MPAFPDWMVCLDYVYLSTHKVKVLMTMCLPVEALQAGRVSTGWILREVRWAGCADLCFQVPSTRMATCSG